MADKNTSPRKKIGKALFFGGLAVAFVVLSITGALGLGIDWVYDGVAYSNPSDPNNVLYREYRRDRRAAVTAIKDHLRGDPNIAPKDPLGPNGTSPAKYHSDRHRSAELAYDFSEEEARLLAEAQGKLLPTHGSTSVAATQWVWHDTGFEVFKGDDITCWGAVFNSQYQDKSGEQIPIGCDGLSKPNWLDSVYTPIISTMPTGGFTVRIVDRTGMEHAYFAGSQFRVPVTGHLFVRANGPYRANISGRTHNDLFTIYGGGEFSFKRIPPSESTEEQ
jgi:hypothetical protein